MTPSQRKLARNALLAVLVLSAAAALLSRYMRRVEMDVATPPSVEVRADRWFALRAALGQVGIETEVRARHNDIRPADDVLVWTTLPLRPVHLADAERWVRAGNHLVWLLDGSDLMVDRPVLSSMKLPEWVLEMRFEPDRETPAVTKVDGQLVADIVTYPTVAEDPGERVPEAELAAEKEDQAARDADGLGPIVFADVGGVAVSRRRVGDGWLTLVNDPAQFANDALVPEQDRSNVPREQVLALASFTALLAPPDGDATRVVWISRPVAHAWYLLVAGRFPLAVIAAGLLALVMLWRAVPRWGPRRLALASRTPDLLSHLQAVARLLTAEGATSTLLDDARALLARRITRRGEPSELLERGRARDLAARLEIAASDVALALHVPVERRADLPRAMNAWRRAWAAAGARRRRALPNRVARSIDPSQSPSATADRHARSWRAE